MGKRPVTSGWALTWNLRPGPANVSKAPMSWPLKQVLRINRSPPGHFASSWKMECTGLGVWAGQLWVGRPGLVRGSKFKPQRKYRGIFFWTEWWQHIDEVGIQGSWFDSGRKEEYKIESPGRTDHEHWQSRN